MNTGGHDGIEFSGSDRTRWHPPEEAFSILGNETRMGILQALWDDDRLSFSELRERVGAADSGNFNYHLNRLADHFIRRTEEGYELRYGGEQVIRAVLMGSITEDPNLRPVEIDAKCPYCGSAVEMRYEDDRLMVRCTCCDGIVSGEYPVGTYMSYNFPPAGLRGRTPEEVLDAAHTFYDCKITPTSSTSTRGGTSIRSKSPTWTV